MARAGWCDVCGEYVYLSSAGGCSKGHGPEHVSRVYDVPDSSGTTPQPTVPESAPTTPSSVDDLIAEASRLADERVRMEYVGESMVVQSDSMSAEQIVEVLDRALALKPGDIDLMLAKSDILALGMQFKSAEDVVDEILAHDPHDFEARTRKDHWGEWSYVFTLPHWSEDVATLSAPMAQNLAQARSVQMVRCGVRAVPAIVRGVQPGEMTSALGPHTRVTWEPVWSQSPAGALVAHYLMVEDDPANPYRAEAFLPPAKSEKASRMNGYWLVRQLAHADGCFIVLVEGSRVVLNRWHQFSPSVKAHLRAMEGQLDSVLAAGGADAFQQAVQWHTNNFDMDQIAFDRPLSDEAAGVSAFSAGQPAPAPEPAAARKPTPQPAPEPEPTPQPAAAPEPAPQPAAAPQAAVAPASAVFADVDALLGDPSLAPQVRAFLLLNLCQIAEAIAPDRVDAYWAQLVQFKTAVPKEHAEVYKQLAEDLGEPTGKGDEGVIPALVAEVAAAKAKAATDRDGAVRDLASVEGRLSERKMPFGKKRVYNALADAWLGIDRGQAIRLLGATSNTARAEVAKRMHSERALTPDEWRMVASVVKPVGAAQLAAEILTASDARLHLPPELVEAVGAKLVMDTGVGAAGVGAIPERLNAHERLVASLADEGRLDEAWAQIDKLYTWATTANPAAFGGWLHRFSITERCLNEAVAFKCLPEERFVARVEETPVSLQAYVKALYRAKTAQPATAEANYQRLQQDLAPQALQRPMGYRMKHGGDPAKLADAGHRAAALTLYLMRIATSGMAKEALFIAERAGDEYSRMAVIRTILAEGDEAARALLPPEQFAETSAERFLALGTAEARAEHLARVTNNGARTIPGYMWRDWDAAQAMPQVKKMMLSKETEPKHETPAEYAARNPLYRIVAVNVLPDVQFTEWLRTLAEYEYRTIDTALLPALVAWSERDWQSARNCMVWMWEAIKPTDELLLDNVLRDGIIKRSCAVLAADPEVLGSYVLPWLHEELVKKGRTWQQGNQQITLRLTDQQLSALSVDGALALAGVAPARRDRVVEIVLGYASASPDIVKAYAQIYMEGRDPKIVTPPVAMHPKSVDAWQEGVVAAIVGQMRKRLLLAILGAST